MTNDLRFSFGLCASVVEKIPVSFTMQRIYHNIALIGMMGSGKSAVGAALAARLGWRFVDTDAMVVASEGRAIADIFARDGEEAFRRMETEAVRVAASGTETVIATGGGAVLRPENRDTLWARCFVVWLTATPEEHVERTARGQRRPVLDRADDRLEAVRRLLSEREPLYALADHREDTSGRSVTSIVEELLSRWSAQIAR